jgi:cobalamin biosynthesis Mg chelatase CobN
VHNARLLTNEDALRLKQGNNDITMARNMPPANPSATASDNGQTQPASAPNAPAGAQNSNQQASTDQSQNSAQSQSSANATTPAINQNQQNNDASGSGSLPATATFLPLFGILGLASGGLGVWFRKFRK